MWSFFWITVVGGFIKWVYAKFIKDDVSTLDTIALVYSIAFFIVLLIFEPDESDSVTPQTTNPIEINQNSDLKEIQKKDKEWRESFGTGVLDND